MKKGILLTLVFCLFAVMSFAQKFKVDTRTELLAKKKWKIVRVDGRYDDRFQMGETLDFHRDGRFYFEGTKNPYSHGDWVMDGKYIILQYKDQEDHATISERMQIKKLKDDQLVIKTFKVKSKGWQKHTLYLR